MGGIKYLEAYGPILELKPGKGLGGGVGGESVPGLVVEGECKSSNPACISHQQRSVTW